MSSPTSKDISKAFPRLSSEDVRKLEAALAQPSKVDEKSSRSGDDDYLEAVDAAMEETNKILDGHGVEAVQGEGASNGPYWRDTILVYVNLGDTYDTTICYDTDSEEFFIGSWGDFLQEWEEDQEDEDEDDEEEEEEDEEEEDEEEEEEDEEEEDEEEEEHEGEEEEAEEEEAE